MKGRKWMMMAALSVAALLAGCGDTAGRDALESSSGKGSQEGNETIAGNTNSQDMQENGSEVRTDIPLGESGAAETGDAQDGEKEKEPNEYTEYEYDENGNMVKWSEYHHTGEGYYLEAYAELEYDQRNNLTKRTIYHRYGYGTNGDVWTDENGNKFTIGIAEWEYDDRGNLVKEPFGQEDSWITEWECDTKGNLLPIYGASRFANSGVGRLVNKYEYGENGKLVWEVIIDSENNIVDATKFEYDQYGRLVHVIYPERKDEGRMDYFYSSFHDSDRGYSENDTYYEYDAAGRLEREKKSTETSTQVGRYDYVYDENGNKVEALKYQYKDNSLRAYRKWEYDEAGNVIKEFIFSDEKWRVAEEWEYDDQGNVSKWTHSPEGPGTYIHIYQYYDDGSLKIDEEYGSDAIYRSSVYDRAGTLILTSGYGVNINSLEYDDAGMIRKLKYGDYEMYYEFEYDGEGRIVKISY